MNTSCKQMYRLFANLFTNKLTIPTFKLLSTERIKLDLVINQGLLASVTVAFSGAFNNTKMTDSIHTDIVRLHTKDLVTMNSRKLEILALGYINVDKIKNTYGDVEDMTIKVTFGDHLTSELVLKKTQEMKQLNSLTSWKGQVNVCREKQFMETGLHELASALEIIFGTPRDIAIEKFQKENAVKRITSGEKVQSNQAVNDNAQAVLQETWRVFINFNCIDTESFKTYDCSTSQIDRRKEFNMSSTKEETVEKINNAVAIENPEGPPLHSFRSLAVSIYDSPVEIIRVVCSIKNDRKRGLGKAKDQKKTFTKVNKRIEALVIADQDNYGIRLCMFF